MRTVDSNSLMVTGLPNLSKLYVYGEEATILSQIILYSHYKVSWNTEWQCTLIIM